MAAISLCTEIGYSSLFKYGEQLCGDHIEIVEQGENSTVIVLADGLGSGVKANILSTLTSKIIATMMANNLPIEECVSTIAATLPVCAERGVAYSTFTIIRVENNREAEIIQYDNPTVIFLRDGKNVNYPKTYMEIEGKQICRSRVTLQENDVFIAMSDGVSHAGVGKSLSFGWEHPQIIDYMQTMYDKDFTAKMLTTLMLAECSRLYDGKPGDDTTVCTVKIRSRKPINLLMGPPSDPKDVRKMMSLFFSKKGRHIVCGGTTTTLAAEFLGKEVEIGFPEYLDPDVPPICHVEGIDLATEGVITITKVLSYAHSYLEGNESFDDWNGKHDGASLIAKQLFEIATDINFYVGRAVNPAHQNPTLPINFNIKMQLIEELSECLRQMGKRIKVSYF